MEHGDTHQAWSTVTLQHMEHGDTCNKRSTVTPTTHGAQCLAESGSRMRTLLIVGFPPGGVPGLTQSCTIHSWCLRVHSWYPVLLRSLQVPTDCRGMLPSQKQGVHYFPPSKPLVINKQSLPDFCGAISLSREGVFTIGLGVRHRFRQQPCPCPGTVLSLGEPDSNGASPSSTPDGAIRERQRSSAFSCHPFIDISRSARFTFYLTPSLPSLPSKHSEVSGPMGLAGDTLHVYLLVTAGENVQKLKKENADQV
ncbi:hypothetical protein P7K49_030051 [Saguinus oedipus]|uniref:Uncharacterized protein n=1 Tax=Saguinus oedipus TaxID=9490 RepID=A0ABQ9U122_SAGOE|nr:hypothetical protein P7K49_030051 [Saguinus oedipus]